MNCEPGEPEGGSFDWKLEVLVSFLRVKSDQKSTSSPPSLHALFSPNVSDKRNFYSHFVKISSKIRYQKFEG